MDAAQLNKFQWKTRDGQRMLVSEMTSSHLRNTIGYLRNRMTMVEAGYRAFSNIHGEMAEYCMEQSISKEEEKNEVRAVVVEIMIEELKRRGISP